MASRFRALSKKTLWLDVERLILEAIETSDCEFESQAIEVFVLVEKVAVMPTLACFKHLIDNLSIAC